MSLASRAYKVLCARYRDVLAHQQTRRKNRARAAVNRFVGFSESDGLETLEPRVLLSAIIVDLSQDINDPNDGHTSLREAINAANNETTNPGADTITFAAEVIGDTFTWNREAPSSTVVGSSTFSVTSDITIVGPVTLDARSIFPGPLHSSTLSSRHFYVSNTGTLTLNRVTLINGLAHGRKGGDSGQEDFDNSGNGGAGAGGGSAGMGGAIFNDGGTVNIVSSVLRDNLAVGGLGGHRSSYDVGEGGGSGGGGLFEEGPDALLFGSHNDPDGAPGGGPNGGSGGDGKQQDSFSSGGNGGDGGRGGGGGGGGVAGGLTIGNARSGHGGDGGFGGGGGGGGGSLSEADGGNGGAGGFGGGGGGGGNEEGANPEHGSGGPGGLFGGEGGRGTTAGGGNGGGGGGLGGAIFNYRGTVNITDSSLLSNRARGGHSGGLNRPKPGQGAGGAVFNYLGDVHVTRSTLSGNTAAGGNAVISDGFDAGGGYVVSGIRRAEGLGGAIYNFGTFSLTGSGVANLTVTDSTISGNIARNGDGDDTGIEDDAAGGGVFNGFFGTATFNRSTLSSNTNNAVFNQGILEMFNSTVALNGGSAGRVAIHNVAQFEIRNSTIALNTLGGLLHTANTPNLGAVMWNTLLAENGSGASLALAGFPGVSTPRIAGQGNIIGSVVAPFFNLSDLLDSNPVNVVDAGIGSLANNGGPTQTISLDAGSIAIGAGFNAEIVGATDQRGVPFGRIIGTLVDSGAYEKQFAPTDITLSGDTLAENLIAGTVVGSFSTVDQDSNTFTYRLVSGVGSTDNTKFNVSPTGVLTTSQRLDFELSDTLSIRVESQDESGKPVEKAFTIHVTDVNDAPVVNTGGPYTIVEGQGLVLSGSATDQDSGSLTFAWDLNGDQDFSDATGANPTLTWEQLGGFGIADNGSRNIALRVSDGQIASVQNTSLMISNAAPTLFFTGNRQVNEGASYTITLLDVADPGNDTVTSYKINWGDGQSDNFTGNPIGQTATHTYADGTTMPTISIDLTDEDGAYTGASEYSEVIQRSNNVSLFIPHLATRFSDLTIADTGTVRDLDIKLDLTAEPTNSVRVSLISPTGTEVLLFDNVGGMTREGFVNTLLDDEAPQSISVGTAPFNGSFQPLQSLTAFDGESINGTWRLKITVNNNLGSFERLNSWSLFSVVAADGVTVNNVAPTIALTGAMNVNEGSLYTLNLGTVTDPGVDTVTGYRVNWGDGTFSDFSGNPAGTTATHTYADGNATPTIAVDLTDEDGTHTAGTKTITVNNLAPTIALTGAMSVNEGSPYTLNLVAVTDPGADTVTGYRVNWGDGTFSDFSGNPAGTTATHTYADGDASLTITIDLTDDDGTHISAGTKTIAVTNAPPVFVRNQLTINEGQTVTLSPSDLAVTEVGADLPSVFFTVDSVTNGRFALASDSVNPITTFTRSQVNNGDVVFVHNGGEAAPTYTLITSDGEDSSEPNGATITFINVNDAPVNTVSGSRVVEEDSILPLGGAGIRVSDVDVDQGTGQLQVDLSVFHGTLSLGVTAGVTGDTDGSDGALQLTGSVEDLNAALATLGYRGNPNYNSLISGPDIFTMTSNDLGNTGIDLGVGLTDTDTVNILVLPINDAPVNTVPDGQVVDEDTPLNIAGISVLDVDTDEGHNQLQVDLSVSHGTLSLGTSTNTHGDKDGSDGTIRLTGTPANLNAALATLGYQGNQDYNGPDLLTMTTDDLGNTGSLGAMSDTDTVAIRVDAENDNPTVANEIGDIEVEEDAGDTIIDLSNVFADVDIATNSDSLTLVVTGNTDTGLVTTTLVGTQLTLDYVLDQNGTADIIVTATDLGGLLITDTFTVTVDAVNDNPTVANAIGDVEVDEDAGDTQIDLSSVFADVDNLTNSDSLILTVTGNTNTGLVTTSLVGTDLTLGYLLDQNGSADITITATDLGGLLITDTFTVTVNEVNDYPTVANAIGDVEVDEDAGDTQINLSSVFADVDILTNSDSLTLTVTGNTNGGLVATSLVGTDLTLDYLMNQHGSAEITVTATDSAGLLITDTFTVTVNAVNDAPVNTVPGAQETPEDIEISIAGISVSDLDADEGSGELQVNLSVMSGTLSLDTTSGLTGDKVGSDGTLSLTGSVADLNAALATLGYQGNSDFNGSDTLNITTSDLGNSGLGGALTDTDTAAITVNAVNDNPTVTNAIANVVVNEDASDTVIDLSNVFADVDIATNDDSLALVVTGNTNTGLVTTSLVGTTLTLGYLTDQHGSADIIITATDSEGLFITDTFTVTVNAVNDAPVNTVPGAQETPEDIAIKLTGVSISDLDADEGSGELQVDLSVTSGTLSLDTTSGLTGDTDGSDGTLILIGSIADLNTALATLGYLGNLDFNGDDTLTITTSDLGNTGIGGVLTDTDTIAIAVLAADEQAEIISDEVQVLEDAGTLGGGQAKSLLKKLDLKGKDGDIDKIEGFISHLEDLVDEGELTDEEAQPLFDLANDLLQSLISGDI